MIETDDGILLKSAPAFRPTQLEEVVGILQHSGDAVSLEDMQEAVRQGAQERIFIATSDQLPWNAKKTSIVPSNEPMLQTFW